MNCPASRPGDDSGDSPPDRAADSLERHLVDCLEYREEDNLPESPVVGLDRGLENHPADNPADSPENHPEDNSVDNPADGLPDNSADCPVNRLLEHPDDYPGNSESGSHARRTCPPQLDTAVLPV